jgi:hypothetical protein
VTGIDGLPQEQLRFRKLNVNRTVDCKEDRFIIKEDLPVSSGKPNMREVLYTSVSIANKEVKAVGGKVNISGELIFSTLYKTDDADNALEFMEHEVPFSGSVDVANAADGMMGDVTLRIIDSYIQPRPNEDGEDRILEAEVSVGASVKVSDLNDVTVLDDAYCINKTLRYTKETVCFPKLIFRNKNQSTVKEIVNLPEGCPDILQVFRVSGTATHDETRVQDDRITVEGVIHTDIIYFAGSDDTPLFNHKAVIPYKQVIEAKGACADMDVSVETSIDHTGYGMLSEREVELRFLLNFTAKVVDNNKADIITDIEFTETDRAELDKMAAIAVYIVQPGDSLWDIAKRYNAGFEELSELNEISDPDAIYPGQKLVVVKKVYE